MKGEKNVVQPGVRLPISQYERIKAVAKREGVSFNKACIALIETGLVAQAQMAAKRK